MCCANLFGVVYREATECIDRYIISPFKYFFYPLHTSFHREIAIFYAIGAYCYYYFVEYIEASQNNIFVSHGEWIERSGKDCYTFHIHLNLIFDAEKTLIFNNNKPCLNLEMFVAP